MKTRISTFRLVATAFLTLGAATLLFAVSGVIAPDREGREEIEREDHPDDAIRFRELQLRDENGKVPADGLQKAKEHMEAMKAAQAARAQAAGKPGGESIAGLTPASWTWIGPGNVGGRIRSIVIDPSNANKMWVGSVSGGMWSTTNAGASWAPVNDLMASLAISTIVLDPSTPTTMYAGTGELFPTFSECDFDCNHGIRGGGIFKSTDGGLTWSLLANTDPARRNALDPSACTDAGLNCQWSYVDRLAISPDGSTLLAATANGIWRSTDGGATWTAGFNFGQWFDIDFDPTAGVPPANQNAIASAAGVAGYSTDGGQSWSFANFVPSVAGSGARVEVAYAPSSPNIVYASVNKNSGDLYQSTDGGKNYVRVNNGTSFLGTQGNYDNIVWVNPLDPTFVIVGGIDLWLSTNCVAPSATPPTCTLTQISRWQCAPGTPGTPNPPCSGPSAHADHHMVVAHPAFNNTTNRIVFFGNDGGVFRADDISTVTQGSGWTSLNNNLGITQFFGGAGNPDTGSIIGGAQDNGTALYTGNAQGWAKTFGGDGGFCAADPADSNYFYGEYSYLALFRSSDAGGSAQYIYCDPVQTATPPSYQCNSPNGITEVGISNSGPNFVAPFTLDPSDPNTMLAGGNSLWRTNDVKSTAAVGPIWRSIKNPVPNTAAPPANLSMSAIAVSPSDSSTILVGYNDGQVHMTRNGTASTPTWSNITAPPLPGRFVTRLVIDNTKTPFPWIYATFGGFVSPNVFRSTNLGATWTPIGGSGNTALPAVPIRVLTISQTNPNFLYVGTEVGLFASEDAGATWQLPQGGPANVAVDDLFWLKGNLIAVTHGRGMYSTIMPVSTLPECVFSGTCGCRGDWNCACSWPSNHVPGPNDDVEITCPMTVSQGASCKNLRVNGHLTLTGGNLNVSGTLINEGLIDVQAGMQNGISCGTLINLREKNAVGPKGQIAVVAIGVTGDATNTGFITLSDSFSCNNLTNAAIDGSLGSNALTALGVTVRGNIFNNAIINARGISISNPGPSVHNLSGIGQWQFTESLSAGETTQLVNDMTFAGGAVSINQGGTFKLQDHNLTISGLSFDNNNGTLSLGAGNLLFTGTNHFNTSNASGGSVTGTGTITLQPSGGFVAFGDNNQFQPNLRIASGVITSTAIFVGGNLTIDPGATLSLNGGTHTVNGDILLNGSVSKTGSGNTFVFNGQNFTNTGSFISDFTTFNNSGSPRQQTIIGSGTWQSSLSMAIGGGTGSTSTTKLLNDVTLSPADFSVGQGSVLNLQNFTLTYAGGRMTNGGQVIGTGKFKMAPSSGTATLLGASSANYSSEFRIASGTINCTSGNVAVSGPFIEDFGATLAFTSGSLTATGNVATINGTLSGGGFNYAGNGIFTNAGSVVGTFLNLAPANFAAPPVVQQLAGSGTWTSASGRLFVDTRSSVTLASDVAYTGPLFFLNSVLNTDVYTFTLPCTTDWQGTGEIVGNVRRTNLSACGGAVAYGSPFTTIVFTGGTPPTEVTVKVALGPPAGFPNAVQRTYTITPTGGSGYTATLRLHYLDSELNGNNESTMQLYRNNGTSWNAQGASARDTANNWVEYNNVTQFSPWTIASVTPPPPTPSPTPSATPTASPVQTPTPTATPTPPPNVQIAGTVFYCSNSPTEPASNITLALTGGTGGPATTDTLGNYTLSVVLGGNYTVTPSKAALAPGADSTGINTIDVVATQRHFLNVTVIPPGCRRTAADVNGDAAVNTIDVVAIQRFYIGQTAGSANVGKYQFSPANRTYSGIGSNQSGQDFNALVFGDVVSPFVQRPEGSTQDAADDSSGADRSRSKVATVALPDITAEQDRTVEVTTSRIMANDNLVGFQGDFTFDSTVISFENEPVQKAGLTAGNWNVLGNVLPGSGPIRTLRISAYSTDITPLSGEGVLFQLKLSQVNKTDQGVQLIWAEPPNDFFFIDANLKSQRPGEAVSRSVLSP